MLDTPPDSQPPVAGDDSAILEQIPVAREPFSFGWLGAIALVLAIPLIHMMTTVVFAVTVNPELLEQSTTGSSLAERLSPEQLVQLLAFDQGIFVLVVFLLAWWYLGRRFSEIIPLKLPPLRHVLLIGFLVLPLAVMDGFLAQSLIDVGETSFGVSPSQGELPELLDGMTKDTPAIVLLLILALAPALGEELVFRGVIGRGLINRKGIFVGILGTSLLFSVIHGNPVQAVGVFFVGVLCHVSYLSTRTLAAPILLHFLNNTLPVLALKAAAQQSAEVPAAEQMAGRLPPLMAFAAMVCVAVLGCLIWKSRVDADNANQCPPLESSWKRLAAISYVIFLACALSAVPA